MIENCITDIKITWFSAQRPDSRMAKTILKLRCGDLTIGRYSEVNHVWIDNAGQVVWPVEYGIIASC